MSARRTRTRSDNTASDCSYHGSVDDNQPGAETHEYRVDELADAAGVSIDTVRFYQRRSLIDPPRRVGRVALYGPGHLERIAEIRRLAAEGYTLAQIGRRPSDRTVSRSELAERSGVPEPLISLLVDSGVLRSTTDPSGQARFDESAIGMLQAGLAILSAGVPLDDLTQLAAVHAGNVETVVDSAIELFVEHVKGETVGDDAQLLAVVEALLPEVTRLVAQHFHHTLVSRALERVRESDNDGLERALVAADVDRLAVRCEWR